MRRRLAGWMVVVAIGALGCGGSGGHGVPASPDVFQIDDASTDPGTPPAGCLGSVWVPSPEPGQPDFNFEMTTEAAVDVAIVQLDSTPWPEILVSVYDTGAEMPGEWNLLAEGLTGADGRWSSAVVLLATQSEVRVVGSFMGAKNWALVPVVDGKASIELGRGE